jgi:hypothetical protein
MDEANTHPHATRAAETVPGYFWPAVGVFVFGLGFALKETAFSWWLDELASLTTGAVTRAAIAGMIVGLVWGLGMSWMVARAKTRAGIHHA